MAFMTKKDILQVSKDKQTLVIHQGKVYDVSKFVNVHPGGSKILTIQHGKDVTKIMENGPHSHSRNAYRWLKQYYVADYKEKEDACNGVAVDGQSNGIHLNGSAKNHSVSNQMTDIVNWDEPMLWQVGHLGEKYHDWVDDPVDRPLRLFKSDFFEFFSNTRWYMIPLVWIPVIVLFLLRSYAACHQYQMPVFSSISASVLSLPQNSVPVLFVFGVLLWTLLEYALHRWLFHRDPPTTSYFLITLHFLLHGQHHKVPFDSGRLVFPPAAAACFLVILYPTLRSVFSAPVTDVVVAGILAGYVCYDMIHYYLHYGSPKKGSYFDGLRGYHVRHHFESPHLGFGISSRLWDYPFQTLIPRSGKAKSH